MKKVYQTVVDKDRGNCAQAVVASLFELELDETPNFIDLGPTWFIEMKRFFDNHGFWLGVINPYFGNQPCSNMDEVYKALEHDNGVNGYFYAGVHSKTFYGQGHAVVVDKLLNIVHDPNSNNVEGTYSKEDIRDVYVCKKDWIFDTEGKFSEYIY